MRIARRHALVLLAVVAVPACSRPAGVGAPVTRQDIALPRQDDTIEARVPKNVTLETLLRHHDLPAQVAGALIAAVRETFDPRQLRANQVYRVTRSLDGLFREFQYQIDADRLLRVVARAVAGEPATTAPAFDVSVVSLPKDVTMATVTAEITREQPSLIAALLAQGESVQLALQLADIFGGEVDFNSDLQRGDRVDVLFERQTRNGERLGYGNVQLAVLSNDGRRLTGLRHVDADGKAGWYDEQGRSLRRQFLRSPLLIDTRITSRFSYRRLHPVHGDYRPHYGVDYGAAAGTPVVAVAAGVVEMAAVNGEAGRMVQLRHTGGYETLYLHLSAYGPGIRPGARVEQGQMIGRVGSSGTATAAHLDYRVKKNGTYVNPLVELNKMPKGDPISATAMASFLAERDRLVGALDTGIAAHAAPAPTATPPGGGPGR